MASTVKAVQTFGKKKAQWKYPCQKRCADLARLCCLDRNCGCSRKRGSWANPHQWFAHKPSSTRSSTAEDLRTCSCGWGGSLWTSWYSSTCKGRRTHIASIRPAPSYRKSHCRLLCEIHWCIQRNGTQEKIGGIRSDPIDSRPTTDGTQEVRGSGCPCAQTKEVGKLDHQSRSWFNLFSQLPLSNTSGFSFLQCYVYFICRHTMKLCICWSRS